MKKYRKRIVPDYESKYHDTEPEYYGVFIKKENNVIVSVRVDPKRLRKTQIINNDTYNLIQSLNRNSPYFEPAKKISKDYCFEVFRKGIEKLRKLWATEVKPAISKIQTPEEAGERAFLASVSDGVMDYDESQSVRLFETVSRISDYSYAVKMFMAQFVLLIGAQSEAIMVSVIARNGYTGDKFSRKNLNAFVSGHVPGLDYKTFDNHESYDRVYKIWNFLKHNNCDVYRKVKENYPDLLIEADLDYINGEPAVNYLNLSEELINDLLEGLTRFFDEFCNKVFGENTNFPEWNTEAYYVRLVKDAIEDISNPLGLPWYI